MKKIRIPYHYKPRAYQLPFWQAMDNGKLRAVLVWHRRSGKDKTLINFVAAKMQERVGAYYYFFPTYNQGRKILWDGRDKHGFKFTDHIPQDIRTRTDNTQMLIEIANGSIFQIIGTDKIDSIVGTNPIGAVFSEYALQDPQAWSFLRPILAENGGWAVFNYTPRGNNHGKALLELAQGDPAHWFAQVLTVNDTLTIPQETLDQELNEIVKQDGNDAVYQQEYMCSFDAPIRGSYYGHLIEAAGKQNRITNVPYEGLLSVDTYWDLGIGDSTAIWFVQRVGMERRIIDYYEASGEGLGHYVNKLREKGYTYGRHYAPHDIEVKELGTGKSRKEMAATLGLHFLVVRKIGVDDGIQAARALLSSCYFDKEKTERGLDALKSYHKEYDEDNKTFKDHPHHDWSSHAADAFRYFAVADEPTERPQAKQTFNRWAIG